MVLKLKPKLYLFDHEGVTGFNDPRIIELHATPQVWTFEFGDKYDSLNCHDDTFNKLGEICKGI